MRGSVSGGGEIRLHAILQHGLAICAGLMDGTGEIDSAGEDEQLTESSSQTQLGDLVVTDASERIDTRR